MVSKRWVITGFEVAMIVIVAVLLLRRLVPMRATAPSPANAVTFTLTGLDGNPVSPSVYKDKAVLLNFWAPWCPPCRMEIPWLQKLQNENRGKLVVVGVVADSSEYAQAAAFMRNKGITYLLVQDSPALERAFGDPSALPTSFYISPSSHVIHSVTGLVPEYTMHRYAADAMRLD